MARIHLIYFDINTGYFPGVNHGLAGLAAVVRQNNHFFSFHHLTKKESPKAVVKRAIAENPDVIGFSFSTNQKQYVPDYARALFQKTGILQIAGGIHSTIDPLDVFKIESIKGVCIGEAEYPVLELLNRIDKKEDIYDISGIFWRKSDGTLIQNPVLINPVLSKLPFPDYSIFDTEKISRASSEWIALLLTRGCPYNCYYCCNHVIRNIYENKQHYFRIPPAEYAINLIKNSLGYYKNPKGINFADDLLTVDQEWLERFADIYSKEIKLPYTCNSRIENLSERVVNALKKSRCKTVYIGIESGNEGIRKKLLNRHYSNKDVIEAFGRLRKAGISTFSYNIVGLPFETKEQMKETLEINKLVKPNGGTVFYFYPYPKTELFNICKKHNLLLKETETGKLSGYLEGPAIELAHCSKKDCLRMYNKIRLFLISQTVADSLKFAFLGRMFYWFCSVSPGFWVKALTKNSKFKFGVRKLFYKYFFK